jgi:hypothetical protein
MRFIKVIALGIIGLLLGIALFQLDTSGYFERWHKLSNPPAEVLNLFSPGIAPDEYGNPQPCDESSTEFSFLSNTPKEIVGCIQRIDRAADATTRTVYVTNGDREIWMWSYFDYAYDYYAKRIYFPTIGLTFGVVIALFMNKRASNKQ